MLPQIIKGAQEEQKVPIDTLKTRPTIVSHYIS